MKTNVANRLLSALFLLFLLPAAALAIDIVDEHGEAIMGTSVFDADGALIGIGDDAGHYDVPDGAKFPLTIRSMCYDEAQATGPHDRVVLSERPVRLSEIVVRPGDRPVMRIVAYARTYMTMQLNDTTYISTQSEAMVDYFIPVAKAKGFKAHESPRTLRERNVTTFRADGREDKDTAQVMDLSGVFTVVIETKGYRIPDKLKNTPYAVDEKNGKSGSVKTSFRKNPKTIQIYKDALAGKKDHERKVMPGLLSLLGIKLTCSEATQTQLYENDGASMCDGRNLLAASLSIKAKASGRTMRRFLVEELADSTYTDAQIKELKKEMKEKDSGVNFKFRTEVYPVERTFLTVDEAKELLVNRPDAEFVIPENAAPIKK